jgi:hypothetical protein
MKSNKAPLGASAIPAVIFRLTNWTVFPEDFSLDTPV